MVVDDRVLSFVYNIERIIAFETFNVSTGDFRFMYIASDLPKISAFLFP